jgi:hypothetical protein
MSGWWIEARLRAELRVWWQEARLKLARYLLEQVRAELQAARS